MLMGRYDVPRAHCDVPRAHCDAVVAHCGVVERHYEVPLPAWSALRNVPWVLPNVSAVPPPAFEMLHSAPSLRTFRSSGLR